MKIFIKPSGMEVPVNETSEAAALALGWVPKDAVQESPADAPESVEPRQKRKYTRRENNGNA